MKKVSKLFSRTLVIPMAGDSNRFKKAGIKESKFSLDFDGISAIARCLLSFSEVFHDTHFVLILGRNCHYKSWLHRQLRMLGLNEFSTVVCFSNMTSGPAETIYQAMTSGSFCLGDPLFISVCDLFIQPPAALFRHDIGGLVFASKLRRNHWAFVDLDSSGAVKSVSKKNTPNDDAFIGMCRFDSAHSFMSGYEVAKSNGERVVEIEDVINANITFHQKLYQITRIDSTEIYMMGTPEEFKESIGVFRNDRNRLET